MMQHEQNPAAEGEWAARRDTENQARADRMRETCREAMRYTVDRLRQMLEEVDGYLASGNDLAALGTLIGFSELAEDLKAAQRLLQSQRGRR
jgi:phosphoenolpyruvate carboxylase